MTAPFYFAVAIVVMLGIASLCRKSREARKQDVLMALYFGLYFTYALLAMYELVCHVGHSNDGLLLKIDVALGLNSAAIFRWFGEHRLLGGFFYWVYLAQPLVINLAWIVEQNKRMRWAEFTGGTFCFVFYALVPAMGPHSMSRLPNCFPSMHFTGALLIALNTRYTWLRRFYWLFAVLTAVATISTGEHYVIDLVAAIPYTWAVQWAVTRVFSERRTRIPEHREMTGDQRVPELVR